MVRGQKKELVGGRMGIDGVERDRGWRIVGGRSRRVSKH